MWFGKGDKGTEEPELEHGALRASQYNMSAQQLRMTEHRTSGDAIGSGNPNGSGSHHHKESFDMHEDSLLGESSVEQPKKAQAMMWTRPVIQGEDLDNRLRRLRAEEKALRVPAHQAALVDPESGRYRAWLGVMILFAAFQISTLGYYLSFHAIFSSGMHAVFVIDWLVDLAFIVDLWVQFNTGFLDEEGTLIILKSRVRRRYLTSAKFVFDAAACLPLDLLQPLTGWEPRLRLNKYLRIWSLIAHFSQLMGSVESPKASKYIALVRLVLVWLLMPNVFATMRLVLVRDGDADDQCVDPSVSTHTRLHSAHTLPSAPTHDLRRYST